MIPIKVAEPTNGWNSAISSASTVPRANLDVRSRCNGHYAADSPLILNVGMQFVHARWFIASNCCHIGKRKWLFTEASLEMYDRLEKNIGATIALNSIPASSHYVTDNILAGNYPDCRNVTCTNDSPIPQSPLSRCKV